MSTDRAAAFEQFKTTTLLQFRANHRAQQRPAETLEADTAELEARIEAMRERRMNFLYD
jgi:hypothetical protein